MVTSDSLPTRRRYGAAAAASSAGALISASAEGRILRPTRLSRPADDTSAPGVHRGGMRARLLRLRPDPLKLDAALAVVLTVGLELEAWLTGSQPHHRLFVALVGPVLTLAIAIRRRYPATVGAGAGIVGVVAASLAPPNLATFGIAWICDMYALAAWSRGRRFTLGMLAYLVPALAAVPVEGSSVGNALQFIVPSTVVILLVHR